MMICVIAFIEKILAYSNLWEFNFLLVNSLSLCDDLTSQEAHYTVCNEKDTTKSRNDNS